MKKFDLSKYEIKKNQIINAAFKCIYEHGIEGVTMRAIAKEAKMNQALLHYYFESKENLICEFVQVLFKRFIYDIEKRYKATDSPEKKLDDYFQAGKDFLEKQPELFVVLIDAWAYCFRNSVLQKHYATMNRKLTGVMKGIIAEGQAKKLFNQVSGDAVSILFVSFVIGGGCLWHMDNRSYGLSEQFEIVTNNLRNVIFKTEKIKTAF